MKLTNRWNGKMLFTAEIDQHSVQMDSKAPLGSDQAMTPKQLVLAGLTGCTAMDVVALMRKYKQPLDSLTVEAEMTPTEGAHPIVFKKVDLLFRAAGQIDPAKLAEAVRLSQSQYCGVSAMLSKTVPIEYRIELNGQTIGNGAARFA